MPNTDLELPEIDESTLGPCMRALTKMQRRYVRAVSLIGNGNHTRAAAIAGYAGDMHVLSSVAHTLAHNPKIAAAIVEEGIITFQSMTATAVAAAGDVMDNPNQQKAGLKLKAAFGILDRGGLGIQTTHNVKVTKDVGDNTVMLSKLKMALDKGIIRREQVPAQFLKMLEKPKEAIDVEFSEVVVDPDAALLG